VFPLVGRSSFWKDCTVSEMVSSPSWGSLPYRIKELTVAAERIKHGGELDVRYRDCVITV